MDRRRIERTLLSLLAARDGRTICPSDVARALAEDWRPLMEPVRVVARALVRAGRLEITQRGRVIDPATAHGPIRLRTPRR